VSHADEIAILKRTIRAQLNMAARHQRIDGLDALAILMGLAAEMVAQVQDDGRRAEYIQAVTETFPAHVLLAHERPVEATLQ
jgi:hypothetical protein